MDQNYTIVTTYKKISKWSKRILYYSLIAGVVTGIGTIFLKNYYKATTSFYPASLALATPSPLGYADKDRYAFGGGSDVDRLFSISTSYDFRDYMIQKYKLAEHYDIDTTTLLGKKDLHEKFIKLFSVKKNKYDAVELSYEDIDRELAVTIANDSRDYLGNFSVSMVKKANKGLIESLQSTIDKQEGLAKSLSDSINRLKTRYNIIESRAQGVSLAELYMAAMSESEDAKGKVEFYRNKPAYRDSLVKYQASSQGYTQKLRSLSTNSRDYGVGVNELLKLEMEYNQLINQASIDKERIKQLYAIDDNKITSILLIEAATTPLTKSRPHRSIIVISAMLLMALTVTMVSLFLDSDIFKNIKEQL